MIKFECKRCGKEFDKYDQLRRHTAKIHKVNSTVFFVEFYFNGKWPMCKCGCEKRVKWSYQIKSFRNYCAGHQSRVHNNWGNNPVAVARSAETRRKQFASGERKVWNDGLTIGDERVKNNVVSLVAFTKTPEERKARSERLRKNRLNGTVRTLCGSEHPQWIDGRSNVTVLVYADRRLYKEWKRPILIRDGFKCRECGKPGPKLHIHHDKEYMNEIISKHMVEATPEMLQDFEVKRMIADSVVDYHIKNKVSGVTLCDKCHEKYHPSLNF